MAVIHQTTLKPTKLELLTAWLPTRPWYRGDGVPSLVKAGGFRLDDPQGEVGMEFMVVADTSGARPVAYFVPLTYRGAPLDGAEDALVGTMEHGVLGRRWAYDGCHDPVLLAQFAALIEGRVQAQDQNVSDTVDQEVSRAFSGDVLPRFPTVWNDDEGTELKAADGTVLRLQRVLGPADAPEEAIGHVAGAWTLPDGVRGRGLFAVLRPA
ncbi:1,4-alpha-glucan branching protein [Nonomuraea sp. AD125B]|uniref:maltokinase N-terminal cap-like domain-containing protein n=1 Tax=Nonomuraea sp. AD125B TaxID=3242897 RepID=UPI0035291DD7